MHSSDVAGLCDAHDTPVHPLTGPPFGKCIVVLASSNLVKDLDMLDFLAFLPTLKWLKLAGERVRPVTLISPACLPASRRCRMGAWLSLAQTTP